MLGGLPTDPTQQIAADRDVCSGFHECIRNDDGHVRISSVTSRRVEADPVGARLDVGARGRQQVT